MIDHPRIPMMRRAALLLTVVLLQVAAPAGAQQPPPHAAWRALETAHFRITYAPGLDSLAVRAAAAAETAYGRVSALVTKPPSGRIELVLTDHVDITNGSASPFPSNRILVFARPPVDEPALSDYGDWLDLVITHELTHSFHLDRAGSLGMGLRAAFGRIPLFWPFFPALGTPRWNIEGLAVAAETQLTGAGRNHGTFHEMVVRTAALGGRFDRMDRLNAMSPIWPGDQRVYIYGSLFMDYLADRYGGDVYRRLVDNTASATLPPLLFFDRVAQRTFGASFDEAYAAWRDTLALRYAALADSLGARGLTEPERVTTHGYYAVHPRLSPDGGALAYAVQDGRETTSTRVLDAATGRRLWQQRRNGTGGLAWLPDGSGVVVSQLEYASPYDIFQDLYVVTADSERRITRRARLQDPDVARDGTRVVAVENGGGTNRIVLASLAGGGVRGVTPAEPDVHWAFPRFSPDGARIAAARWTRGGEYDVVVLDTAGALLARLTADRAIDTQPAWSPDGRWLVFSSDRTGIANLYAADVSGVGARTASGAPALRQITNVLTGAFHPDVSADGRWIHFSHYAADGYHIARMPFDPARWRDPAPVRVADEPPAVLESDATNGSAAQPVVTAGPRQYSSWPSIAPTAWVPALWAGDATGTFVGASTWGVDVVGRYAWGATVGVQPSNGLVRGALGIGIGAFGNPRIDIALSRDWDDLGGVRLPDDTFRDVIEREDVVGLFATFLGQRWRNSMALSLGAERELRRRTILESPDSIRLRDARDALTNLVARAGFANYRRQPFSISREDGVALNVGVEHEIEADPDTLVPAAMTEFTAVGTAYRSLHPWGFANHVVALRGSALLRMRDGAVPTRIGGVSGSLIDVLGVGIGDGSLLLPVRGFERGDRAGTHAWTASAEYRLPVALIGRRPTFSPLYLDRISALLFADAGDAWCRGPALQRYASCRADEQGNAPDLAPLMSAGAEIAFDVGLTAFIPAIVRTGIALPIQGPRSGLVFYLQLGSSF
jgi:Tol biopolymer transport system component